MKVVLVGTFGLEPKGTVSMRAIPLGVALSKRGYQVTVIVPPWDNPKDSGKIFNSDGINVINVKVPPPLPILWHLVTTFRMLVAIFSLQPDVVHCFKPKGFAGLVADVLWLLKKTRVARMALVMDTDDLEGSGGWNDIQDYSPFQRWFFAEQEKRGLRLADAVTAASLSLVEFARSLRGSPDAVYYVPNGAGYLQQERFSLEPVDVRARFSLDTFPIILLYTRFFEFSLSRALSIIAQVFQKVDEARLLVVGQGLHGEEQTFADMAKEKGIDDKVVFAGWVRAEQLASFFEAADVAIYPMDDTLLNRTKCPVKLIDSLSFGVPVVADRVGQIEEYIEDEKTGFLVSPSDPSAFAERVLTILTDDNLGKRLGAAAAKRINDNFLWDKLVERVEEAYTR